MENGELVTKREDSVCSAARVRKLEATSEKKATKGELIVVAPGSHECSEPLHSSSDGVFGSLTQSFVVTNYVLNDDGPYCPYFW